MMFKVALPFAMLAFAAGAMLAPSPAHADDLLIKRVQQEKGMNLPARGLTKSQVVKRYGEPLRKLAPRGGDTRLHPVINRWEYAKYIVYFEHDHVIHSVLNTPAGNNRHPKQAQ